MRFMRALKDLVGLPAVVILFVVAVLGNLGALTGLFPQQDRDVIDLLMQNTWIGPVNAWLSRAGLPNWAFVFVLVALIAVFERAYRKLGPQRLPEPSITLAPKIETRSTPGGDVAYASLTACNNERQAITECFATLETAAYLGSSQQKAVTRIRNSRLRWAEDQSSDNDCTLTLPPGSGGRSIAIANTASGFQFSFCRPSSAEGGLLGLYVVKIRVDGKLKGSPIEPQVFDGYLYVSSARKGQAPTIVFERGDWNKDRRLPRPRYLRVGNRQFRLPW